MMQSSAKFKKAAFYVAVIFAILLLGLRVGMVLLSVDHGNSAILTAWDWLFLAGVLLSAVVLGTLVFKTGKVDTMDPLMSDVGTFPLALLTIFSGAVLLITNLLDAWTWFQTEKAPSLGNSSVGGIDNITLIGTLVFGILGGAVLAYLGFRWILNGHSPIGILKVGMLAPVLWIWMYLARYEISYASTVSVQNHYVDFLSMIVLMLFLYHFARMVSGLNQQYHRVLLFLSLFNGIITVNSVGAPLVFAIIGNTEAFALTDGTMPLITLAFGALSFALAIRLTFTRPFDLSEQELAEMFAETVMDDGEKSTESNDSENPPQFPLFGFHDE